MDVFNKIMTSIFHLILYPLQNLSSLWGLAIVSVLTGILMVFVFKLVSNQQGIRRTKNRIKAHLLAIRLYKSDAILSLGAMGQLFGENGRYFLFALKPMLVLSIPVTIILIQVGSRYGYQPAQLNRPMLVSVRVSENIDIKQVSLDPPAEGIKVESPPLYIPSKHEIYWRISSLKQGTWMLTFSYLDQTILKKVVCGPRFLPLAAKRIHPSLAAFLYPAEPVLPSDAFIREINVEYSDNNVKVAGIRIHWLVFFLVVSIATGYLAKGFFRVQI